MQRSLFCRFSFALAVAIAATFAAQAETYYYVGGDPVTNTTYITDKAYWAKEDGTPATADIATADSGASGDTIIFTNANRVVFGGEVHSTPKGVHVIKRGLGDVVFAKALSLGDGTLTLEGGDFCHGKYYKKGDAIDPSTGNGFYIGDHFGIEVVGTAEKKFYLYGAAKSDNVNTHYNVTIPSYFESYDAAGTMAFSYYGSNARTMTFKGPENSVTRFSATMELSSSTTGATFIWDPGYSSSIMEIVGRNYNVAKGSLKVSSGTMRFGMNAGVSSLSNITVAAGAVLEIADRAASDTFGCPIIIEDGGKLKVSRCKFMPSGGVTYNGAAVSDGRYKAGDFNWLEGDGALYVGTVTIPDEPATTTATWDGGGENTLLTTKENWDGDVAPNLTDGSLVATFPTGTEATVPAGETVAFKGISVSAPSFTLKGGEGSKVALGSSGLTVTGAAFTNECFTTITRSQTWDVAADCEFAAAGEVAAEWPTIDKLMLSGAGKYILLVPNPRLCNVDYYTTVEARADVPLGQCLITAEQKTADKVIECFGNVFSNNFTTAINNWGDSHYNLFRINGGVNVFCGRVESNHQNGHYWQFRNNDEGSRATAVFKGGYIYSTTNSAGKRYETDYSAFSPKVTGTMTVEDIPMDVSRIYIGWPNTFTNVLNLSVASNTTTRGIHVMRKSVLNTTVPYALYATDDGQSGVQLNDLAVWNLSAVQGVNVFAGITNTAVVASSSGATLHLRDDRLNTVRTSERSSENASGGYQSSTSLTTSKVQTNKVAFVGNVCFSKEGVLDHFMEGVSTSTGSVTVKKGRMIFTTGSWQNASGVLVSDGGTLELRNGKAFSKDTPVAFTGENTDGMLFIPAGTTVKLRKVTVNGTELSGMISDGLVTGGGTLAAGKLGLSIIFR